MDKHSIDKTLKNTDDMIDELKEFYVGVKKKLKEFKNDGLDEEETQDEGDSENNDRLSGEEDKSKSTESILSTKNSGNDFFSSLITDVPQYMNQGIKLESQKLTHFYGHYQNWMGFWDDFNSSVHSNLELSPIQKFKYLKSVLHDEPYRIISAYPLSNNNYQIVIDILKNRYGNTQLIKEHLTNELNNLKKINESTIDLRKFILQVNRIILQLKNYRVDTVLIMI